ncbi:hypothetical protein KR018_001049 [Drosophila ironensis]|nr:hypothetical protein KR018_001049 [Drosophila ironensis]
MKLILFLGFIAFLGLSKSQTCNPCDRRIDFLCGQTIRNREEVQCTFENPCEMDRHACLNREGNYKNKWNRIPLKHLPCGIISPEWRKLSTGRCTRDSTACRR